MINDSTCFYFKPRRGYGVYAESGSVVPVTEASKRPSPCVKH